jgi:hypothetical protein
MKSNEDNSFDPLRLSYWKSWLASILICLGVGITVGICSQSLVAAVLSYFLLSFMLMALVVFKLFPPMDQESEHYWNDGL